VLGKFMRDRYLSVVHEQMAAAFFGLKFLHFGPF
jgi:hypothetical protein